MSVENTQEKKKRNKPLLIALIGAGALVATVGGVFAANSISINSGGQIEFGQGIASTNTCDSSLTTAINQAYSGSGTEFDVSTVVVSDIDDSACLGKTLHVSLINSSTGAAICNVDGTHGDSLTHPQDQFTIGAGETSVTITPETGCDASNVGKVAITTS